MEQALTAVWQHIKIKADQAMFTDALIPDSCSTELQATRLTGIQPIDN